MGRNVVVISASGRRGGNSDLLCDELVRGAQEAGGRAEKVRLSELNIGYCRGCGACFSAHRCVQRDDMDALSARLKAADAIVMASPVYFYSINGQLKAMIDRLCPHAGELKGKDFYFILSAADTDEPGLERAVEPLRGLLDCVPGAHERALLYARGVFAAGEVRGTEYMQMAYELGREAGEDRA